MFELERELLLRLGTGEETTSMLVDMVATDDERGEAARFDRVSVERALSSLHASGLICKDEATTRQFADWASGGADDSWDPEFRRTHLDNWWRISELGRAALQTDV